MPYITFGAEHQHLKLFYELHGSGEVKILFIMGLMADGAAWIHQTDFFRQHPDYQCVTYDNRGCSRSSSPLTYHYTTVQMAKDALGLISHLKWSQCHVVGVSMGGMIAMELALLAPNRIRSLTFLATHAGGLVGQAPWLGVRHILRSARLRDQHLIIENALEMLYAKKTLSNPDKRQNLYSYHTRRLQNRLPPTLMGTLGQLCAVQRHYVSYADLLKIRYAPFDCLIMVGTEDRLVRETNSYLLQRTLGCRLVKLDDAGHGLYGEYAQEINEELFKFFESTRDHPLTKIFPKDYRVEIEALEYCCQHRTHCFVYDFVGLIQGYCVGLCLYFLWLIVVYWIRIPSIEIYFNHRTILWIGSLNGLRRSLRCIYHAFHARRFVLKHQLQLDRVAHHGGIGVRLPEQGKTGIPAGCGFELPLSSFVFIIGLVVLLLWTRTMNESIAI